MDNFSITENREPSNETSSQQTAAPKKTRRNFVLLAGLVGIVILFGFACCPFVYDFAASFPQEMNATIQVLDEYMKAMADRDAPRAFAVVAKSSEPPIALNDLESLLRGNNYILFKGYRDLALTGFNLTQTGADKYAEVEGNVLYEGNFVGEFSANVIKENGDWKIQTIKVSVPPDKFGQGH